MAYFFISAFYIIKNYTRTAKCVLFIYVDSAKTQIFLTKPNRKARYVVKPLPPSLWSLQDKNKSRNLSYLREFPNNAASCARIRHCCIFTLHDVSLLPKLIPGIERAHLANPNHAVAIHVMSVPSSAFLIFSQTVSYIPIEMGPSTLIILPTLSLQELLI